MRSNTKGAIGGVIIVLLIIAMLVAMVAAQVSVTEDAHDGALCRGRCEERHGVEATYKVDDDDCVCFKRMEGKP